MMLIIMTTLRLATVVNARMSVSRGIKLIFVSAVRPSTPSINSGKVKKNRNRVRRRFIS